MINNNSFEIIGFAPVFDHNYTLLCRIPDNSLEHYYENIDNYQHFLGGNFITVAEALLTDSIKRDIQPLLEYSIIKHDRYNLDKNRISRINEIIRNEVKKILH